MKKKTEGLRLKSCRRPLNYETGFTLMELVMVIVILGVLSVSAYMAMPDTDLRLAAAAGDFKQAVRHAQHLAITREYTTAAAAWGISTNSNHYTIKRADDSATAETEYVNQSLSGGKTISNGTVWFNGLGEPVDPASGNPLAADTTFTIGATRVMTVYAQTGFIE